MTVLCEFCDGNGFIRNEEYDSYEDDVIVSGVQCPKCKGSGEKDSTDE